MRIKIQIQVQTKLKIEISRAFVFLSQCEYWCKLDTQEREAHTMDYKATTSTSFCLHEGREDRLVFEETGWIEKE